MASARVSGKVKYYLCIYGLRSAWIISLMAENMHSVSVQLAKIHVPRLRERHLTLIAPCGLK